VPPTQVALWAGQSVEILFRIYAKCPDGGEAELHRRIDVGESAGRWLPSAGVGDRG
jgi:hypothetical protein